MRFIPETHDHWSCQNNNSNYLMPFGVIENALPEDNFMSFVFYTDFAITPDDVELMVLNSNSGQLLNNTTVSYKYVFLQYGDNGAGTGARLIRIDMKEIADYNIECFYIRIKVGAIYYKSEPIKIFKFQLGDPPLLRFESTYKEWDILKHDIELGKWLILAYVHPNYYLPLNDGKEFRNIQWFYGEISQGDMSTTYSYEGINNANIKNVIREEYNLYFPPLPHFHAKELHNVLSGANISIYNNDKKILLDLDMADYKTAPDPRTCMVAPTGVKLIATNTPIYHGCE